jgi:glyoxylate/succinic semialdehyde reductase
VDFVEREHPLPSIGFLGLGIMGTAMARNLVKAGYDVTVWNRTTSKCDALVSEGAKRGASPMQTAGACDITFAMLADPAGAVWSSTFILMVILHYAYFQI